MCHQLILLSKLYYKLGFINNVLAFKSGADNNWGESGWSCHSTINQEVNRLE